MARALAAAVAVAGAATAAAAPLTGRPPLPADLEDDVQAPDVWAQGHPPRPPHWGDCPDICPNAAQRQCEPGNLFTGFVGSPQACSVINVIGVSEIVEGEQGSQWEHGLRFFAERLNAAGGLRLGDGSVGYLNVTVLPVDEGLIHKHSLKDCYKELYQGLCHGPADGWHLTTSKCGPQTPASWRVNSWGDVVKVEPKLILTPP